MTTNEENAAIEMAFIKARNSMINVLGQPTYYLKLKATTDAMDDLAVLAEIYEDVVMRSPEYLKMPEYSDTESEEWPTDTEEERKVLFPQPPPAPNPLRTKSFLVNPHRNRVDSLLKKRCPSGMLCRCPKKIVYRR